MGSNQCRCSLYAIRVINTDGAETFVGTGCANDPSSAQSLFAPGHDAKLKSLFVKAWFEGPDVLHEQGRDGRWSRTSAGPLEEARLFSWGLSVSKAIDQQSAKLRAARVPNPAGESRATRAVMRALQRPDGRPGSHDPIGATFGTDLSVFTGAAQSWLRDKTELSTRTIASADYGVAFNWFINGEA